MTSALTTNVHRYIAPLGAALLTGCIVSFRLTSPSYWRDEAATLAAIGRPFPDLLRLLTHVDAVHGAYYILMWPLARLLGTSEMVMRLPSCVAMAISAALVTAIGRRLRDPWTGALAGALFAVFPTVSEYGQMARSYALVLLSGCLATYVLVRADQGRNPNRRYLVAYCVAMAVTGMLNILALLLGAAHLCALAWSNWRGRDRVRAILRPVIMSLAIAVLADSPLIWVAAHQQGQIFWIRRPGLLAVGNALDLAGSPVITVLVLLGALWLLAARIARPAGDQPAMRGEPVPQPVRVTYRFCIPWMTVPAVVLIVASVAVRPVYDQRYILFCLPGVAILSASVLADIAVLANTKTGVRAVLIWAAAWMFAACAGLPMQIHYRSASGHLDNIRAADAVIARYSQKGDDLIYSWPIFMFVSAAYPYGAGRLDDLMVGRSADASATLAGTPVSDAELRARVARARRLWVIIVESYRNESRFIDGSGLRLARQYRISDIWLDLYTRAGLPA
jgi:mannosyltransferase